MQRIYLDTNIITHLKDGTDDKLLDFLNKYGRLFIFPYSPAHFDDLTHGSLDEDAEMRLQQDIKTMDLLCGDNLVDFDKEKDMLIPYRCLPSEYVKNNRIYHTDYYTICNAFVGNQESSEAIFNNIPRLFGVTEGESPLVDFSMEMLKDVLGLFSKQISGLLTSECYKNQFELLSDVEKKFYRNFHGTNPDKAFDTLENHLKIVNPDFDFNKFINQMPNMDGQMLRFVGYYLALNYHNYHKDNDKKSLSNIIADAKHCYYATCCDVLVTNDFKMQCKAQAVYHHLDIGTKVIAKKDFASYIHDELEKEFAIIPYFRRLTSNLHFKEHYDDGQVHVNNVQFSCPAYGFFHSGMMAYNVNKGYINYMFRLMRNNDNHSFVYYTERERFFVFINALLNEECQQFLSSNFISPLLEEKRPSPVILWANKRHKIVLAEDDEIKGWPCIWVISNKSLNN